jgi:phage-related protein
MASGQMPRLPVPGEKPLYWMGSAEKDLLTFPEPVKDSVGKALSLAQFGGRHPVAKAWKGAGSGVLEIVVDHAGNTFRAVYMIGFAKAVYVLHAFQKKSPRGIKTARRDVELVSERLKQARKEYQERYAQE